MSQGEDEGKGYDKQEKLLWKMMYWICITCRVSTHFDQRFLR